MSDPWTTLWHRWWRGLWAPRLSSRRMADTEMTQAEISEIYRLAGGRPGR
jgi:hypothetical protein